MRRLTGYLVTFLLIPLGYSYAYEAISLLISYADFFLWNWFAAGFLSYALLFIFFPRRRVVFIETFEHELGHALVALLFLKDIREFLVNPEKGSHVAVQNGSNPFIVLAPYYLPVFTLPLFLIKLTAFSSIHSVADFLIGFTLAFHYIALVREFNLNQTDIQKMGFPPALLIACLLNSIFLAVVLNVVRGDGWGIPDYFEKALIKTWESYGAIFETLRTLNDVGIGTR